VNAKLFRRELVLFGSVEKGPTTPASRTSYDSLVSVIGRARHGDAPQGTQIRHLDQHRLPRVSQGPTYLGCFQTGRSTPFASPEVSGASSSSQQWRLTSAWEPITPTSCRTIRSAVPSCGCPPNTDFIGGNLRGDLPDTGRGFAPAFRLPGEVAIGTYEVDIKLFSDGALITRTETAFDIVKVGFEQFVAHQRPPDGFTYGLVVSFMALMTGWMASMCPPRISIRIRISKQHDRHPGRCGHRARNLEIPRCAIAHLRSGSSDPSRNDGVHDPRSRNA